MMYRCALCGILIPETHRPREEEQVWYRKVFAVQREEEQSQFSLTPFGYSEDGSLEAHPVIPPSKGLFIHQSCWPILQDQMFLSSGRRYDKEDILQVLFDFVQSMPRNGSWVSYLCHEDEEALWKAPGENIPEGWEFLNADAGTILTDQSQHHFLDSRTHGINTLGASSECFAKLSTEMNHYIVTFLDTVSFCNLRLSSRTIANITKPEDLPQAFWASRFSDGREMGFFPLDRDTTVTWRELYFDLKHSLHDTSTRGHMRNRRRIWNCIGNITPCMISMLRQPPCLQDTDALEAEVARNRLEATQRTQGFKGALCGSPSAGIRVTGSRYLNFRPRSVGSETLRISVSRVNLDKRDYICGFRILKQDGAEIAPIGLVQHDAETHFSFRSSDKVIAVHVAVTFGGIIGLAFRVKDALGGVSWKTVGKVDKPDEFVGIKMLKPQNGGYISGLLLGLDACKVASIQLVERQNRVTSSNTQTNLLQQVWHPAAPQPDVVIIPPITAIPTAPQPAFILNMDFGGPSGSLLPLLNRIAIFHDDRNLFIKGLGFYYTDGTAREFGVRQVLWNTRERWSCIEQSLFINGSAGERITGVGFRSNQYHEGHVMLYPFSLMITTNYGRRLKATNMGKPLDDPEDGWSERHNLASPNGETITGFLAPLHMSTSSGAIESLGLVHLNHREPIPTESPLSGFNYYKEEARSRVDPKDERYTHGHPSSTVRLDGVKRIGISIGRIGRTRRPDNVSGFCFEFWDGRSPVFVGQWYEEIAHLDLDEGDRIASFTFWEQIEIHPNIPSRAGNGKFSGARIEKSGAEPNAVEVHPGEQGDIHESCYAENHFERLDGFIWGLSYRADSVQIVTKPTELANGCLSRQPHEHEAVYTPSNKLFWRIQDREGNWTSVSQINAFFNSKSKRLCGLEFIYRDNQLKQAGYTEGTKTTLTLDRGEEVTGASWRCRRSTSGDRLSFHMGDNRTVRIFYNETLVEEEHSLDGMNRCQVCETSWDTCDARNAKVSEGVRKCVGVYMDILGDLKHRVVCRTFGQVYVELADGLWA